MSPLKATFQPAEARARVSEMSHAVNFAHRSKITAELALRCPCTRKLRTRGVEIALFFSPSAERYGLLWGSREEKEQHEQAAICRWIELGHGRPRSS